MAAQEHRLGKYLIRKPLGRGGMGAVFLAVQEGLDRPVALKVLQQQSARNEDLLKRFRKEISVCARLSHPNIVKVFDAGYDSGAYWYAMELLEATSLEDRLRVEGRIPIPDTLKLARDLVEAFRYYFPLGIVHRDLKPANIMMDASGKAIITDFGLVKDLLATGITRSGVAVGTPYYMAPEMVLARQVGPASDIYQLGIILYRMLTGVLPFRAEKTADVFAAIVRSQAEAPSRLNPEIYPALETFVLNCMSREVSGRYQDAETLSRDLAIAARKGRVLPLTREKTADVVPTQPIAAPPKPASKRRVPWLAAGAAALAVALAVLGLRPAEYAAVEMRVKPLARHALVTWSSPSEYPGRVEVTEAGGAPKVWAEPPRPVREHAIRLEGLAPGREYQVRALFPDGGRSLPVPFRTLPAAAKPLGLRPLGKGWQLELETPMPALVAAGGSESPTATRHQLALARLDVEVTVSDGILSEKMTPEELRRALLPSLSAELGKQLASLEPGKFLLQQIDPRLPGHVIEAKRILLDADGIDDVIGADGQIHSTKSPVYRAFAPGDPIAAKLGEEIREWVVSRPFYPSFSALLALGQGVPEPYEGLSRLREIDQYAGALGIPYRTGVEALFTGLYRIRYEPALPAVLDERTFPGEQIFACPWREYQHFAPLQLAADWKRLGPQRWQVNVKNAARLERAELQLTGVYLLREHRFSVTVNDRWKLRFANDPQVYATGRNRRFPIMAQSFDPRILREGPNDLYLEMEVIPGMRTTAVKNGYLASVRLAAQ